MILHELNSLILMEWWATKVAKDMKKKGTVGAFTQDCKNMGFKKASMECIKYVEKEYIKIKALYLKKDINKKEYNEWLLKKKRATLAKTFKKWASTKKKKNKTILIKEKTMKLKDLLVEGMITITPDPKAWEKAEAKFLSAGIDGVKIEGGTLTFVPALLGKVKAALLKAGIKSY